MDAVANNWIASRRDSRPERSRLGFNSFSIRVETAPIQTIFGHHAERCVPFS
jgi:hypothetical protein